MDPNTERITPTDIRGKVIGPPIHIPIHPEVVKQRRREAAISLYKQGYKSVMLQRAGRKPVFVSLQYEFGSHPPEQGSSC